MSSGDVSSGDLSSGDMWREIHDQPRLWRRLLQDTPARVNALLEGLRPGREPAVRKLWLVGCGDMHFAADAARWLAAPSAACLVEALSSMEMRWLHAQVEPQDLVVAASVSGRTPRTQEALLLARAHGARCVALTDDPTSELAGLADHVLVLGSRSANQGADDSVYPGYASEVPQTRTFSGMLILFASIVRVVAGRGPPLRPEEVDSLEDRLPWLAERASQQAATMCSVGTAPRHVRVLASGPHAPLGRYAAAKLLEFAIPAGAQCLEEFHHLEMFVLDEGDWLVALTPDPASTSRWSEVAGKHALLGARQCAWSRASLGLPEEGGASLFYSQLSLTLAVQFHALALASALGRDVQRWCGGVRRDEIFALSRETIRDSRRWHPEE